MNNINLCEKIMLYKCKNYGLNYIYCRFSKPHKKHKMYCGYCNRDNMCESDDAKKEANR
jgi:hypothetical protein